MVNQDRSARLRSRLSPPLETSQTADAMPPADSVMSTETNVPVVDVDIELPGVGGGERQSKPNESPSSPRRTQRSKQELKAKKALVKVSYRESHKMLGVWLSNELLERLDRASNEIGESKAAIVARAIEAELKRAKIS